jgi:dTDP-glucose 4,6-dehydratase
MIDFSDFKDSSVLVTGATGLIGRALVHHLIGLGARVYACSRSSEKFKASFHGCDNIIPVYGDICTLDISSLDVDYIVHAAGTTTSKDFVEKPVETIRVAVGGTINILDQYKDKKLKGFVYISSMEAFGITPTDNRSVRETDLGYIDVMNVRSSYSESKRLCENLCVSYASEYGVPAKVVRLAQVVGPGVSYTDNRVTVQFARSVVEGKDIVLKTEGKTKRPILYIDDAVSAILTVLLKGKSGECYTAANPETFCTIRDTAEAIIREIAQDKIKLVFDLDPNAGYAPDICLNLNVDKLKTLGWEPKVGLVESYRRLIESLKNG